MESIATWHDRILELETVSPRQMGASLIIAPHQDDETLGCGGTAALLLKMGCAVHFLFMSDGTMSHPNSKKFPAEKLQQLREDEAREAVRILGGNPDDITFLALKDSRLPHEQDYQFTEVVKNVSEFITSVAPETIFVPWRNDPHQDHRATWQILNAAIKSLKLKPRMLEYPVWLWERGDPDDMEQLEKMQKWCVNIETTLEVKNKALAAHVSQVTHLIDDDPEGFILSEQVIAHFDIPREIFFESIT